MVQCMACRIHDSIRYGEIDNRVKGRVTGRIWCFALEQPVQLQLSGNPLRDLAGHRLTFKPLNPKPTLLERCALEQKRIVGDMTASRKLKVPEITIEEVMQPASSGLPWPCIGKMCCILNGSVSSMAG